MLVDAHCHFFTKNMLSERLKRNETFAAMISRAAERQQKTGRTRLLRGMNAARFLRVGFENTPEQMYEYMAGVYGNDDFIAVPLMMDLSFALQTPEKDRLQPGQSWRREAALRIAGTRAAAVERRLDIFERSVLGFDVLADAYQSQIDDLSAAARALPGRVLPFFSVDPRRDGQLSGGMVGEVARHIGPGKPFVGLKLYPSLGYSPTDPVLFGGGPHESVYGWCEKNGVPVTAHAAFEGFSHMLRRSVVAGDVYDADSGCVRPAGEMREDGVFSHQYRLRTLDFDRITQERLELLDHPLLWRKVLQKYPKLKLNLAHFGGLAETERCLSGCNGTSWTRLIADLMHDFDNVYTDLSFFYDDDAHAGLLQGMYEDVYQKLPRRVRRRVMFGSDYFMAELYDAGLPEYIAQFRDVFGRGFGALGSEGAARFLGL